MSDTPKVYAAIAAVQAAVAKDGISKDRKNDQQGYKFRGIDDIYNAVAPLLAQNGLCIMPTYSNRTKEERTTAKGGVLFYVTVDGTFDFVSTEDGSKHVVKTFGEAMDSGDKATNKAMSAAYKYACIQTFCIPTEGDNDADHTTHEIAPRTVAQRNPKDTVGNRAWMIAELQAGDGGEGREWVTKYLKAVKWLPDDKQIENLPGRYVPLSDNELDALDMAVMEFSKSGSATLPYHPHGIDPTTLPTPAKKDAPRANSGAATPVWASFVMPIGKPGSKGKKLAELPKEEVEWYFQNFQPQEQVELPDGTIVPLSPEQVKGQKDLRAMLDLAGKDLDFKAPKEAA